MIRLVLDAHPICHLCRLDAAGGGRAALVAHDPADIAAGLAELGGIEMDSGVHLPAD